ncbi:MAG TPA: hypothetical protein VGO43_16040 [Pyrinomonadaceae bacterium]|jgi:hypothetical protein|nr:hypothetical protein [Pyrinomonadaceae bacterium]
MRNIYFLLAIVSFGIFALAGCGTTPAPTNNTAAKNAAGNANTAAPKTDAPATTVLKPGDVSLDKAVKVIELVDSAAADKDAWKGKEVAVTGYVSGTSGSGDHLLLTLTNDQTGTNSKNISCSVKGVKSDEVFSKTIEVKGKISSINADSEVKSVNLEPCEIKK